MLLLLLLRLAHQKLSECGAPSILLLPVRRLADKSKAFRSLDSTSFASASSSQLSSARLSSAAAVAVPARCLLLAPPPAQWASAQPWISRRLCRCRRQLCHCAEPATSPGWQANTAVQTRASAAFCGGKRSSAHSSRRQFSSRALVSCATNEWQVVAMNSLAQLPVGSLSLLLQSAAAAATTTTTSFRQQQQAVQVSQCNWMPSERQKASATRMATTTTTTTHQLAAAMLFLPLALLLLLLSRVGERGEKQRQWPTSSASRQDELLLLTR